MSDVISITTYGHGPADDTGDGDKRALSHITHTLTGGNSTHRPSHPSTVAHALVVVPFSVSRAPAPCPYVAHDADALGHYTYITAIGVQRSSLHKRRSRRWRFWEPGLDGGFYSTEINYYCVHWSRRHPTITQKCLWCAREKLAS